MKKKTILNHVLTLGLISLFSINLTSCNNTKKEFIEVGLGDTQGNMVDTIWNEFYTGLKAKTQKDKTQDIEVFYGSSPETDFVLDDNMCFVDLNQNLEFKLTRYIYPSGEDSSHVRFEKFEEILVIRNTLEYFLSKEFAFHNNSIIDTIEVNDLVRDYKEYGVIQYKFVISPLDNEPLKLYRYDSENPDVLTKIFMEDKITSIHNCVLGYTIDDQDQITFIESQYIRKENINV